MLDRGPDPRRYDTPWRGLLALTAASIVLRAWIFAWFRLGAPLGEDAQFWGYRALELADGQLVGSHPPGYPVLALLYGALTGWDVAYSAQAVSYIGGALMAPAIALGLTPIVGRGAALLSGAFVVLLPALGVASLRVEPTSLFIVLIGVLLFATGRAIERRSPALGALAGILVPLMGLVKENGLLYTLVLVPAIFVALRERNARFGLAVLGAFCTGSGAVLALDSLHHTGEAPSAERAEVVQKRVVAGEKPPPEMADLSHKVSLPVVDVIDLVSTGYLPPPILAKEDSAIQPSGAVLAELAAADTAPARRLVLYAEIQARRMWRFLGVWLLAAPFAAWAAWKAHRDGELERWQLAMLGVLTLCLVPGMFVLIQPRHAEFGALGIVAASALAVTRAAPRKLRLFTLLALALAAVHGAHLFHAREFEPLKYLTRSARERLAAARTVQRLVPATANLCSPSFWIGFYTDRLVLDCARGADIEAGEPTWYVGERAEITGFAEAMAPRGGTLAMQATLSGESFDKLLVGEIVWGGQRSTRP